MQLICPASHPSPSPRSKKTATLNPRLNPKLPSTLADESQKYDRLSCHRCSFPSLLSPISPPLTLLTELPSRILEEESPSSAQLTRPLFRRIATPLPSGLLFSNNRTAPTHSHTRPTSPDLPSLTIGRTFALPSTFFCTLSHNFVFLPLLNSSLKTSSLKCATVR